MKRIFFFLIFPLLLSAHSITIASWNVENLFDMHYDGTEYAEYIPGRHGWSEVMLRKKLRNISEVICDLDADVIGLEEVENDRVLARLQQRLKRAGCGYRYREMTGDTRTPIHNALLSKIPIGKVRDVRITRYGRQRSILDVTLKTDPPLRLFVNHWRSKRGPESDRLVYAKALKKYLSKLPQGTEYLLLGDFNSNYNESITIDTKHNDTHNITGINDILHTMHDGKMVRLSTLRAGELASLWMELPASERWSHNFFGDKQAIDAMLIPPSLHDGRGWEYQAGSFRVYRPKYLFGRHGAINRWAYKHGKHLGKGYSDHLPIVAVFDTDGMRSVASQKKPSVWQRMLGWFGSAKHAAKRQAPERGRRQAKPMDASVHKAVTVSQIKAMKKLMSPVRLNNAHVLFKRSESAVIQQSKDGEAILLYRSAMQLEEGHCYDLQVYRKKNYKGLPELTDVEVEKDRGPCETTDYIRPFDPSMLGSAHAVGRVVRDFEGPYDHHAILVAGVACAIHFRKSAGRIRDGARLHIKRAQIGYYRDHAELVVWDKEDYRH